MLANVSSAFTFFSKKCLFIHFLTFCCFFHLLCLRWNGWFAAATCFVNCKALLSTPVITDESILVVPGTNGELYGLVAKDGKEVWTNFNGASAILADPIIVQDVLYVIESQNGIVRQHSAADGTELWQIDCFSDNIACDKAVEADFAISPNGIFLYYGDVAGNIVALQIGTVDTPSPTMVPTTLGTPPPILAPTSAPNTSIGDIIDTPKPPIGSNIDNDNNQASPDNSSSSNNEVGNNGSDEDSVTNLATGADDGGNENSDSTMLLIGAGVGVFLILAGAAMFVLRKQSRNRKEEVNLKEEDNVLFQNHYSNRELDYGTPDKMATLPPSKKIDTPATLAFDSDNEDQGATAQQGMETSLDSDDEVLIHKNNITDDMSQMEMSHMSEESNLPVPPPPAAASIPKQVGNGTKTALQMEEKKDDDGTPDCSESISYANMYADNSMDGSMKLPTHTPLSPTSTVSESSVYTGQLSNSASPANSRGDLMPVSSNNVPILPDVFGTYDEGTAGFILPKNAAQKAYQTRHVPESDDDSVPDDERMNAAPGAHYMPKADKNQSLYNAIALRRDDSIEGSGAYFGATRQMSSSLGKPDPQVQDTDKWSNFMSELEEAEKMFSDPNLKSTRLLSDDESTDTRNSLMGSTSNSMANLLGSNKQRL